MCVPFSKIIEEYGVEVTLKSRAISGYDSYGNPVYTEQQQTIKAIVHIPSVKNPEAKNIEPGTVHYEEIMFYLKNDVTVNPKDIIVYDGKEYVVERVVKLHYKSCIVGLKIWAKRNV